MSTRGFRRAEIPWCIGLLAFLTVGALPSHAQAGDSKRFAVFVGSNVGDPGEPLLRFAERDALRMAATLRAVGSLPPDHAIVMNGATADEVRDALIRLNARIRDHEDAVLFVFFSGHADAEHLHLSGTHLPTADLRALLVGSPATTRLLVVDACRSGAMTQIKGGRPAPVFPVVTPTEPLPHGFAILTSSAATEDSQESASLESSFFTHFLNSGLLGAADQNQDGLVTLAEAFAYASQETRAATVDTVVGPQNPTYQFALGGRQDLVLSRPRRLEGRLGALLFNEPGRYLVQRWEVSGLSAPLADVVARTAGVQVALETGRYRVSARAGRRLSEHDYEVAIGKTTPVSRDEMSQVDYARMVLKGAPHTSATVLTLLGGVRSDYHNLGSAWTGLVGLRREQPAYGWEVRLAAEFNELAGDRVSVHTQTYAATAVLSKSFAWRVLTVAPGLEVGGVIFRQRFASSERTSSTEVLLPVPPGSESVRFGAGLQFGPTLALQVPIWSRGYIKIEASLPLRCFRNRSREDEASWVLASLMRLVGGAAFYF